MDCYPTSSRVGRVLAPAVPEFSGPALSRRADQPRMNSAQWTGIAVAALSRLQGMYRQRHPAIATDCRVPHVPTAYTPQRCTLPVQNPLECAPLQQLAIPARSVYGRSGRPPGCALAKTRQCKREAQHAGCWVVAAAVAVTPPAAKWLAGKQSLSKARLRGALWNRAETRCAGVHFGTERGRVSGRVFQGLESHDQRAALDRASVAFDAERMAPRDFCSRGKFPRVCTLLGSLGGGGRDL